MYLFIGENMNFKKYKHLFNIHLFASTAAAALLHFSVILASLFLWEAPALPERSAQEFKNVEISHVATLRYLSNEEVQKILDEEAKALKNLSTTARQRIQEANEKNHRDLLENIQQ